MNSQTSGSTNSTTAFDLLHREIQRWIWEHKWSFLRDIQEYAIPVILEKNDAIIAASTASGKTEAAFFPIFTKLMELSKQNPTAIYISPLKALINDQWSRLELLCDRLNIKITPWHGDIAATQKKKFQKNPSGCVLITPESLESFLMNYGYQVADIFSNLQYCVIDELHAFLGNERGKQLQCLLHRLDMAIGRKVPRVGLSATIGDMSLAAKYLRHDSPEKVKIISSKNNISNLKIALYGYKNSIEYDDSNKLAFDDFVAKKLFAALRGTNNLIFPNTRGNVELFSDKLRRLCDEHCTPNEFWPHHGNLSKDIREETERALKKKGNPATAICTNTLELGIDIGLVKSIAQIGSPPSVSSLRQRIGRSGRRQGEAAILRAFNMENEIGAQATISDKLCEQLLQSIAIILLLLEGWCEPVGLRGLYLSTFIQQLLSSIAQYGGLTAGNAWKLLCDSGIFTGLTKENFLLLLTHLGEKQVIAQDHTGLLLLDTIGEKLVNHYSFYASFSTDEEFRLIHSGKTLGTIPIKRAIALDTYLIFSGKRWRVREVNEQQKFIIVIPDQGGKPPLFSGEGMRLHGKIRKKMREVLDSNNKILFLDQTASGLLEDARVNYRQYNLTTEHIIQSGKEILIFLWEGDDVQDTLALFFKSKGYRSLNQGMFISIEVESVGMAWEMLRDFVNSGAVSESELAELVEVKQIEKWDWLLPENLLCENYSSRYLDLQKTQETVRLLLLDNNK